jgi:hypothetical protein
MGSQQHVKALKDHRARSAIYAAREDAVYQLMYLRLDGRKLSRGTTTPATLATLTSSLLTRLCVVWMVGVAKPTAINSDTLTALATPRYSGAFSQ